jgi:foldase protein PrsA
MIACVCTCVSVLPSCQTSQTNSSSNSNATSVSPANPPTPAGKTVAPTTGPASVDTVLARIDGINITRSQLIDPLVDSYGLQMLLQVTQLQMARDEATRQGIVLTTKDVDAERSRTLKQIFADVDEKDYDAMMDQLLQQQRLTRREFEMVIETNAYLRALAKPVVAGLITEDKLLEAYNTMYGQRVRVRHIALSNMQEVQSAQRRLASGEDFSVVARLMSKNQITRDVGGEMPPFARTTAGINAGFAEAAFALEPGQISNPVNTDGLFHLIKLEEKLAPRHQKFDDVKDSVREQLEDRALMEAVRIERTRLGKRALQNLRIEDPVLARQYELRMAQANDRAQDRKSVAAEVEERRKREAATQPAPVPEPIIPPTPESTTRQIVTTQPTTSPR